QPLHPPSLSLRRPPRPPSTLFPYTTLFRSFFLRVLHDLRLLRLGGAVGLEQGVEHFFLLLREDTVCPGNRDERLDDGVLFFVHQDRKSTRLNSSHVAISYAVFCLKKKTI